MAHPGLGFLFLLGAGIAAAVGFFLYTERPHTYSNNSGTSSAYTNDSSNSWTTGREDLKKRRPKRRSTGEKDCSICLSTDNKCDFKIPQCGHLFHLQCLLKWVENQKTCPNCRSSLDDTFLK